MYVWDVPGGAVKRGPAPAKKGPGAAPGPAAAPEAPAPPKPKRNACHAKQEPRLQNP